MQRNTWIWISAGGVLTAIAIVILITLFRKKRKETYQLTTSSSDPQQAKLKELVDACIRVDPVVEKLKFSIDNGSSYTIDKKHVHLCLKDPKTGEYYPDNTLIYVLLHEISHVLSAGFIKENESHVDPEFLSTFDKLLRRAENIGVYNPRIPIVRGYCGT